ncbi:glycosyltransferase family 4 protein [Bacillus sp. FJAT-27245]|uniref:glycosyltransferase family 4 protein n=1 Tax=Bacillus sp. FJAT-27245 TaxID=1684144 RepID=UPI0006A780E6|nr:glycosyltransferase family 4 protein [Bacillus sp. FJAT-27245]
MKILHVCLASAFTEGMNYQENFLSDQNITDGHDVTVISDCYKYEKGKMVKTNAEDKVLPNGIRLIRLEYDRVINALITGKVRKVSALFDTIVEISPDIILYHGMIGWEMLSVAKYKMNNPKVKLYIDSHEDFNNSARNFISKYLQYKIFNRAIVKKILPVIDKVFYVSFESRTFLKELYNVPSDLMEFFPLGGLIIHPLERSEIRENVRKELGITEEHIVFVHSGKMSMEKRTKDLLTAFLKVKDKKFRLILIGAFPENTSEEIFPLIKSDDRIKFLGWKNGNELLNYLCAADMYLQPGSQSATMQNAICCGCPVMLYPYKSHELYLKNNGYFVKTLDDIVNVFLSIENDPEILKEMSKASYGVAYDLLDYRKLASRLYG